jgi:hypothetical protein
MFLSLLSRNFPTFTERVALLRILCLQEPGPYGLLNTLSQWLHITFCIMLIFYDDFISCSNPNLEINSLMYRT